MPIIYNVMIAEMDTDAGTVTNIPNAWRLKDAETARDIAALLDLYNELGNLFDAMDAVRKLDLPRQGGSRGAT